VSCPQEGVPLAGGMLSDRRHVCAFFNSRNEEYRVLLPFVKEGLERGEKAIHIVDPALRGDHLARLSAAGIDVAAAGRQLEVFDWRETYLRGGTFDRRAMTAWVESMLTAARASGFPRTRVIGHMEWALLDGGDPDALVEYEARANEALPAYDDPLVCTYDRSRFCGSTTMDILRAHPVTILDGMLQENTIMPPAAKLLSSLRAGSLAVLRDRYVCALVAGARREALDIVVESGLADDIPVPSLYLDVIQPAQYELGRLWKAKRIGAAQEHVGTEISKLALAHLHAHLPCRPSNGRRVVVACVEGELHDLGARMVADFLEMAGFDVIYLGAYVPADSLVEFVRDRAPHLLALSATASASLPALRRTIAAVRSVMGTRVPIAAGGRVLLRNPEFGRRLGVDLQVRDARDITTLARRWFNC
jgi:MerR family transcriptional regulator, light-induced transcriptional regulator